MACYFWSSVDNKMAVLLKQRNMETFTAELLKRLISSVANGFITGGVNKHMYSWWKHSSSVSGWLKLSIRHIIKFSHLSKNIYSLIVNNFTKESKQHAGSRNLN